MLLVTWIIPAGTKDQPNVVNSYQSTFASIGACEAARDKVLQDAQRLNAESRAGWAVMGPLAATHDSHVSAVCAETGPQTQHDDSTENFRRGQAFPGWNVFRFYPDDVRAAVDKVMGLNLKGEYRWAQMAAELGSAEAQAKIGLQLLDKTTLPEEVHASTDEGLRWLNRSAQHGCFNAFFYLHLVYYHWESVPKDYVESLKWLILATNRKTSKTCNLIYELFAIISV